MKSMRALSICLCLCLVLSLFPAGVIAAPEAEAPEHTHTLECYRLVCGQQEGEGHTHSDGCYLASDTPECGLEEHQHGEDCYSAEGELTCEQPEHTHGEACLRKLNCELPESAAHQHDESCYELHCTEEETTEPGENEDALAQVQSLLSALPEALTDENREETRELLSQIAAVLEQLTAEQRATLDLTQYEALQRELNKNDLSALPATEAPLSDILGKDEDGEPKMYSTLYDKDLRIVSTNDPQKKQDAFYAAGGTVARGDALYVEFRMAEILPNEGGSGVQENVTYCTGTLPKELIPAETDKDGNQLLNPDAPAEFFHLSGSVSAYGGIYGTEEDYRLKIFFTNVADQIDISGTFQYGVYVSEDLEPGENCTVSFVPGGSLNFIVSSDNDISREGVTFRMGGGSGGPTAYYWYASISKKATSTTALSEEGESGEAPAEPEEPAQPDVRFPYTELTITSDEKIGFWINEANQTIFTAYGDSTGPGFQLSLVHNEQDESGNYISETLLATKDNIVKNENGETVVRLTSDHGIQADISFRISDMDSDTYSNYQGKYAYITRTARVTLSDGNGGLPKDFRSLTLYIPTLVYDDYQTTGGNSYSGRAKLSPAPNNAATRDLTPLNASGYASVNYGNFGTPGLSASALSQSNYDSYDFFAESIYNYIVPQMGSYYGNYYWMEFEPNNYNATNAQYYPSNRSFVPGNSLASADGRQATFSSNWGGTRLAGMVGYFDWNDFEYLGTVSVSQIKNDLNLIANSCFANGGSTGDVKLQYQLKQVFKDADSSGTIIVYRTRRVHSYGEYCYILIDPGTTQKAAYTYNRGWYEYMDGSNTAKPGSFKVHVFNAPCTSFQASVFRPLGSLAASNAANTSSSNYNTAKVSVGVADSSRTQAAYASTSAVNRFESSTMTASWVSDDMIFWTMSVAAQNWPDWQTGYLHVGSERALKLKPGGTAKVGNATLNCNNLYIQDSNGSWQTLYTPAATNSRWYYDFSLDNLHADTSVLKEQNFDNNWSFNYSNASMTQYRSTSGLITIGFFTKVTGKPQSDGEYVCGAELVTQSGDISFFAGPNGYSSPFQSGSAPSKSAGAYAQYPFHISATGYAPMPQLSKTGSLVSTADATITAADWLIQPSVSPNRSSHTNSPIISEFYGGYNGTLRIADSMEASVVKDADGKEISGVNPASFTHITRMLALSDKKAGSGLSISLANNGGGCGPIPFADDSEESGYYGDTGWEKYVSGKWVRTGAQNLWQPDQPGIYRHTMYNSTLRAYVYYAGNMADSIRSTLSDELTALGLNPSDSAFDASVVTEVSGLTHGFSSFAPVRYVTELDNAELCTAADEATSKTDAQKLASSYTFVLSNSATGSMWKSAGKTPETATVERRISAQLSIEKTAGGVDTKTGGFVGHYSLKITNGFSPAPKISTEDFVTGFNNVERRINKDGTATPIPGGSYTTEGSGAEVSELLRHLSLANVRIAYLEPGQTTERTIYENGAFTADWSNSSFSDREDEGYTSERKGSLFRAEFIPADGETIPSGAILTVYYDAVLNMDDPAPGSATSFRQSGYYLGGGLQILNSALASRTYEHLSADTQVRTQALPSGDKTGELLTVDCGGSVSNVYLSKDSMVKLSSTVGQDTAWAYSVYSGTMGKTSASFSLADQLSFALKSLSIVNPETGSIYTLNSFLPEVRDQIGLVLEQIVERHTTYKDIKFYVSEVSPTLNPQQTPENADLLWDLGDLTISGGTELLSGKVTLDGVSDLKTGDTPAGTSLTRTDIDGYPEVTLRLDTHPATLTESDGATNHTHSGFTVDAQGLGFQKYLIATYKTSTDWEAVLEEARRVFGSLTFSGNLENGLTDDSGESVKNSVSNTVRVEEATLSKSRRSYSSSNGTASRQIDAGIGSRKEPSLVIEDELTASLPDGAEDRIRTAAEAALGINPASIVITVTQDYRTKTIYSAGSVQTQNGWTDDNISIEIEGRKLRVTLRDAEENMVLAAKQSFRVSYNSTFDMNAFLQNGGRQGDKFTILNTAAMRLGNLTLTKEATSPAEPTAPVTATKKLEGTEANSAFWLATGGTGGFDRTNFTLSDAITPNAPGALEAMRIDSLNVTVALADGTESSFTPDALPEGVTLTDANGGTFALETVGVNGFRLTFATLAAGSTVSVRYTTTIDRETYLANGGADGTVSFRNSFQAGGDDGFSRGVLCPGSVVVTKPMVKGGKKLADLSENGNPLLQWEIKINLAEKFTPEELNKLDEAVITDALHPILAFQDGTLSLKDASGADVPFEGRLEGTMLNIRVKNPAEHPSFTIRFVTECLASVDGLVNTASLSINGVIVDQSSSPELDKILVQGHYGTITSSTKPVFTPEAWKYVDNELCTEDGKYEFQITAVDEDGNALTGDDAYTETMRNGADGKIPFSEIRYKGEGVYYYQIRELGDDIQDTRVFTVQVTIFKVTSGYIIASDILSQENYAQVRFDNTNKPKTTTFTVTKTWNDEDDAAGLRPGYIVVRLYQDGQPYNNEAVTLSEENNWTYTWEELPVAGGEYSAVEIPVPGYTAAIEPVEDGAVITNTVTSGSLTIRKTVTGQGGETDREFTFTITLTDEDGNPLTGSFRYTGSREGTLQSGESITLKHGESVTFPHLPTGTLYTVTEAEANQDGYTTTAEQESGAIRKDENACASFFNDRDATPAPTPTHTGPYPDWEPTPTPGGSEIVPTPTPSRAPSGTPSTGDRSNAALWLGLMIVSGLVLIVVFLFQRKKKKTR